jgi:predicted nucleic acid-binding protein
MPSLQIRDLPDELYEALSFRAASEHRSLTQQALADLMQIVKGGQADARKRLLAHIRQEIRAGTLAEELLPENLVRDTLVLVPQLYFSETANALWKYVSSGQLSSEQAIERYQEVCLLPDQAISDQTLALEALNLASSHNHPVYDMIYAVLARRNACGVLSRDNRLAGLLESLGVPAAP